MIRVIHNNTVTVNTQELGITIYVDTNKYNPPNSNEHSISQQEQQGRKGYQQGSSKIIS